MKKTGLKMSVALAATLMMMLGAIAIPAPTSAAPVALEDQITVEDGTTEILGGGDHFFVKFGTDAAFGIVWGSDEYENNVYFVAIKARYLGMAQVYDNMGELVEDNRTIKVYSMYAVKLDSIIEFNDIDDNGLLQYNRSYDGEDFIDYQSLEPIYKKVDLTTSWNASEVIEESTDDLKTWEFSLTANDLPYELVDANATEYVGDNVLNNFTLTFHLEANLTQVDNLDMPQWRITVSKGPMTIISADRLNDLQVNGKVFKYDVKWDQMIEGWDYDSNNTNPALLLEFRSIVGNFVSPLMAAWMHTKMYTYMNQISVMNCESTAGELEVNETTGTFIAPKQLIRTSLEFGTDWNSVGALAWVDDVTVDGEPEQVMAQIMAGHRVLAMAKLAGIWMPFDGFVVLGGMVFPGGDMIMHDPTFTTEALVDISSDDGGTQLPVFMLLLAGAIIVIVIAAIAVATTSGNKPRKGSRESYEKGKSSQPGDWSKYYNKK
ncbi:MAG: hypothetical protein KKE24_02430 [Candidatus Thermoplasmatota archaeon]|nr:hypothetical protein [Candidatus Thermoplasmatota archaeon]